MAKNFDEKIFMFPEQWIELRKELEIHWNPDKTGKHPHHLLVPNLKWSDPRCGWALAFDAELFVEYMNSRFDGIYRIAAVTRDDELRIAHICGIFLKELRKRRGEPNP